MATRIHPSEASAATANDPEIALRAEIEAPGDPATPVPVPFETVDVDGNVTINAGAVNRRPSNAGATAVSHYPTSVTIDPTSPASSLPSTRLPDAMTPVDHDERRRLRRQSWQSAATRVQTAFRAHMVYTQRTRKVRISQALGVVRRQRIMINGWATLLTYMTFLVLFSAVLILTRNSSVDFRSNDALLGYFRSLQAPVGGPFCAEFSNFLSSQGDLFCTNGNITQWIFDAKDCSVAAGLGGTFTLDEIHTRDQVYDWIQNFAVEYSKLNVFKIPNDPTALLNDFTMFVWDRFWIFMRTTIPQQNMGTFMNHAEWDALIAEYRSLGGAWDDSIDVQTQVQRTYGELMRLYRDAAGRIQTFNKVYGGVLFRVERTGEMGPCHDEDEHGLDIMTPECRIDSSEPSTDPYVFPDVPYAPFLIGTPVEPACLPWKFQEEQQGHMGFFPSPYLFPQSEDYILMISNWMRTHNLLDARVSRLSMLVVTWNPQVSSFVSSKIMFTFDVTGHVAVQATAEIAKSEFSQIANDLLVVVVLFVVWFGIQIVFEQVSYFWKGGFSHWRKHALNIWTFLDAFNISLYIYTIIYGSVIFSAVIHLVKNVQQFPDGLSTSVTITDAIRNVIGVIVEIDQRSSDLQQFFYLQGVTLIVSLVRVFKMMRFQPRLATVTGTLTNTGQELMHFCLIYGLTLLLFSALANCMFGSKLPIFIDLKQSMITMFSWNLGAYDTVDLFELYPIAGPILFFGYTVFVYLILVNMFLAIIVEGYGKIKTNSDHGSRETSMSWQLAWIAKYYWMAIFMRHRWASLTKIRKCLHSLQAKYPGDISVLLLMARMKEVLPPNVVDSIIRPLIRSSLASNHTKMKTKREREAKRAIEKMETDTEVNKAALIKLTKQVSALQELLEKRAH